MMELGFLCKKKTLTRLKRKTIFALNVFGYENRLTFPIYNSSQKFENSMNLLQIFHGDRSHYVYIKDFDRFVSQNKK